LNPNANINITGKLDKILSRVHAPCSSTPPGTNPSRQGLRQKQDTVMDLVAWWHWWHWWCYPSSLSRCPYFSIVLFSPWSGAIQQAGGGGQNPSKRPPPCSCTTMSGKERKKSPWLSFANRFSPPWCGRKSLICFQAMATTVLLPLTRKSPAHFAFFLNETI
jgi:hypothetical protein